MEIVAAVGAMLARGVHSSRILERMRKVPSQRPTRGAVSTNQKLQQSVEMQTTIAVVRAKTSAMSSYHRLPSSAPARQVCAPVVRIT